MSDNIFLLSDDDSLYVETSETDITGNSVDVLIEVWGAAEFGTAYILGGGQSQTYVSSQERNIGNEDVSLFIVNLPVTSVYFEMTSAMGRWGSAQFGTDDILGAGTLNYYEG